jgi:spermidine synthase/tetratricopeptide (TPR) repeat protein
VFSVHPPQVLAWDISKMTLGAFRISLARDVLDEEAWGSPDVVFHRDGLSTTVTVERWGRHYSMKNNGKVDASNGDDMPTQILVAALPLLMHPRDPEGLDVSVVGFGSGVTVGAALQFPLRSLEVVELEAATVEASRHFASVNHLRYTSRRFPYVSEPRLQVIHDDGRNHLAFTRRLYDVIVSEPSNPWLTGVADLFTLDHFRVAKRRLKPHGVYCQWVQLYEISPENVKSLYRTFAAAFPHVVVFSPGNKSSDTIMLGSDEPIVFDVARVTDAMAQPRVAEELRRALVGSAQDVFARVLFADRDELMAFTHGAPLNTDDNARVELSAPRDLIGFRRFRGYLQTFFGADWPYAKVASKLTGLDARADAPAAYAEQVIALLTQGRKAQAGEVLARAPQGSVHPALRRAATVHAGLTSDVGRPALRLPSTASAISGDATDAARAHLGVAYAAATEAAARGDFALATAALTASEPSLRRAEGGVWDYLEGVLLYEAGDHDGAIDRLQPLAERASPVLAEQPELLYFLARSQDADGQYAPAVRNFLSYLQAIERKAEFATPSTSSAAPGR